MSKPDGGFTGQAKVMDRRTLVRTGALALAFAGAAWCIKAGVILVTGYQPPFSFELGQLFFPVGVIGVYSTLQRPGGLARAGLWLAIIGVVGTSVGWVYSLLPGARAATSEDFVMPHSLFVLTGSLGGVLALLLIGIAIARAGHDRWRWRWAALIVAVLPLAVLPTGAINIEIPILLTAVGWLWLASGLWSAADPRTK